MFESLDKMVWCDDSKERYRAVLSSGTACCAVQGGFNLILCQDEILWCDHSNESYSAVLSCGTVYYAVQGGSNF